jgi:hypothetical protein
VIGLGPRNANPVTGNAPTAGAPGSTFVPFVVSIGGVPAPVAKNVLASADVQNDIGVQAVSVQVPYNVATGENVPVTIEIVGVQSPPFSVTVQSSAIQISLSPATAQVALNGTVQFNASVQGSDDSALKWSIDANAYGLPNTPGYYGSIQGGVFQATYNMTVPNWTVIRATHSSGAFASAVVQLIAADNKAYRIQPDSPVIAAGESISFTLVGPGGAPVDGATWSISDGSGSSNTSTYTAPLSYPPLQVNVWARMPGQYGYLYDVASTTIVIDPPRAQITGTTPSVGHIGEPLTFQGSGVTDRVVYAWFTAADGSSIRVGGPNTSIVVPHGAVSGPVWLELNGAGGADLLSPPYQLTILPRLRLHASLQRVSSGESVRIVATAPDSPGPWSIAWRADLGSVDSTGMFQAPTVTQPAFARIWACLLKNTECGTTIVEILPFRLDPDPLILNPGETVQLKALQGGEPIAPVWQTLTPNISVTPDGTLTVGTGAFDGGLAVVSGTYGGVSQALNLSIRTAGAVAHTAEFYDWLGNDNNSPNGRLALGVFSGEVALQGNWIYALSRSLAIYGGPWLSTWLDVYQLDGRRNPVWVDAVEAPYHASNLYLEGNNLYAMGQEDPNGTAYNVLLHFDVSAGRPVLQSRQIFDGSASTYRHQGLAFTVLNPNNSGPRTLQILDYASGATRNLLLDYVPVYDNYQATASGTSTWAAVMYYYPAADGVEYETVVFDITGSKAEPVALLASGGLDASVTVLQDVLVVGGDVFQVSGSSVNLVSQLPAAFVVDSDPIGKRLLMAPFFSLQEDGYRVVDLSDPANPKTSAATVQSNQWTTGKLGPDYFVLLNGPQNIGVYPIVSHTGIRQVDRFPATPWMNDVRARDGFLYWTGPGWGFPGRSESLGIFEVDDVSAMPSNVVATMDRPGDETGWAIELNGRYAYVGTDAELVVYDIGTPAAPAESIVIPAPAISLALVGNYLYAGSNSGANKSLLVYDVSNPGSPKLVNTVSLPDFAYGATAQPGWLALALGKSGLYIYSLVNPAAPVLQNPLTGTYWGLASDHNLLYAAADNQGLVIYDLSNLMSPNLVSQTAISAGNELLGDDFPTALAVSIESRGISWLCTAKDGRVYGLDVRDPMHPRHIAEMTTGMGEYISANTYAWNNLLFVAGNDAAFDVATPQNVGLYDVPQTAPGQVLPDRYNDLAPVAQQKRPVTEPLKSRYLNKRDGLYEPAGVKRKHQRAFRASRPAGGSSKSKTR